MTRPTAFFACWLLLVLASIIGCGGYSVDSNPNHQPSVPDSIRTNYVEYARNRGACLGAELIPRDRKRALEGCKSALKENFISYVDARKLLARACLYGDAWLCACFDANIKHEQPVRSVELYDIGPYSDAKGSVREQKVSCGKFGGGSGPDAACENDDCRCFEQLDRSACVRTAAHAIDLNSLMYWLRFPCAEGEDVRSCHASQDLDETWTQWGKGDDWLPDAQMPVSDAIKLSECRRDSYAQPGCMLDQGDLYQAYASHQAARQPNLRYTKRWLDEACGYGRDCQASLRGLNGAGGYSLSQLSLASTCMVEHEYQCREARRDYFGYMRELREGQARAAEARRERQRIEALERERTAVKSTTDLPPLSNSNTQAQRAQDWARMKQGLQNQTNEAIEQNRRFNAERARMERDAAARRQQAQTARENAHRQAQARQSEKHNRIVREGQLSEERRRQKEAEDRRLREEARQRQQAQEKARNSSEKTSPPGSQQPPAQPAHDANDAAIRAFCDAAQPRFPTIAAPIEYHQLIHFQRGLEKLAKLRAQHEDRVSLPPEAEPLYREVREDARTLHRQLTTLIEGERRKVRDLPAPATPLQKEFLRDKRALTGDPGLGELYRLGKTHRNDWGNPGGSKVIFSDLEGIRKLTRAMEKIQTKGWDGRHVHECRGKL